MRLLSRFRRKKKDKQTDASQKNLEKKPKWGLATIVLPITSLPKIKRKIRIPGLSIVQRGLCGIMLILNLACFMFIVQIQGALSLFFLINAFFQLKLLWTTRKPKKTAWIGKEG